MRPRLLDLYCCAGGAAMGYHRAGFDVVGVDINPQPNYPFEFHQADALEYLAEHGHEYDARHASPPCQDHSTLSSLTGPHGTGWLLHRTRELLQTIEGPWVIENVPGADLPGAITLCGTNFDLATGTVERGTVWLKRHRLFLTSWHATPPPKCHCRGKQIIGVYGTGDGGNSRGWKGSFTDRQLVMGIDWMSRAELSQSIPPVYTEFIGRQLIEHVQAVAA